VKDIQGVQGRIDEKLKASSPAQRQQIAAAYDAILSEIRRDYPEALERPETAT